MTHERLFAQHKVDIKKTFKFEKHVLWLIYKNPKAFTRKYGTHFATGYRTGVYVSIKKLNQMHSES
jgi:hypothetical protein